MLKTVENGTTADCIFPSQLQWTFSSALELNLELQRGKRITSRPELED